MAERGEWQDNFVQYNPGDIVVFQGPSMLWTASNLNERYQANCYCSPGKRYRNIQGHRSQSDWTPIITPALWEDVGPAHGNECPPAQGGGGYQPTYDQKPPQQPYQSAQQGMRMCFNVRFYFSSYIAPNNPPSDNPTANSGYTTDNGHQVTSQDSEKKWYDLDDTKKDALVTCSCTHTLQKMGC